MLSRRFALISLVLAFIAPCFAQQKPETVEIGNGAMVETALGKVDFPNSCTPAAQPSFVRGVVLLHSFQYSAAEQAFTDAAKTDPKCAMAYWGMAMTAYHPLWEGAGEKALAKGHGYLAKIQSDWPVTAREREYISAIGIIFNVGQKNVGQKNTVQKLGDDRIADYSRAMAEIHKHYPEDGEATAFYALSLLALPKSDDTETRKQAIAILTKLSAELPQHPGAAHYLIHAADTPELAQQGLDAARRYAKIAPDSSHALHMPSHIFVRLGLWQESIDSNQAAAVAAEHATQQHLGEAHYQFHAMDFLDYSYLQMGEEAKARQIVEDLSKVTGSSSDETLNMRVVLSTRNMLELHRWKQALELKPEGNLDDQQLIFATRAIAAARTGDRKAAEANYSGLKKALKGGREDRYKMEDFRREEVEAWVEFAKGKNDKALARMRDAAAKQDRDDPGGFNVPAREMLADMLMELHKPAEALAEYEAVLKTEPNRFNGLYGAVTAAQMAGDSGKAKTYSSQLKEICAPQADREELQRVKTAAAGSGSN
jgi:tetratricopeptide (TPR) repeat protein